MTVNEFSVGQTAPNELLSGDNQPHWQIPPEPIAQMLVAERSPAVSISSDHRWLLELTRPSLPSLADLAEPVLSLAGLQINPKTWGPSRASGYRGMALRPLLPQAQGEPLPADSPAEQVSLPPGAVIRNVTWSYDCSQIAFTISQAPSGNGPEHSDDGENSEIQTDIGIALWVVDVATKIATQLTAPKLNGTYGRPYAWLPNGQGFICKLVPDHWGDPPEAAIVPTGPSISENDGRTAAARTYTNLLNNAHDEALFEYYFSSILVHVENQEPGAGNESAASGQSIADNAAEISGSLYPYRQLTEPAILRGIQPSPDGQWLLQSVIHRPFSYHLPLQRFPVRTEVLDIANLKEGEVRSQYQVADLSLADSIPIAFEAVRTGRRSIGWRPDEAAMLYWIEALDGGDPAQEVEYRDQLSVLAAPFTEDPQTLWKTQLRCRGVVWGNGQIALGYEGWYDQRLLRVFRLWPGGTEVDGDSPAAPELLEERNFQDAYSNPGQPMTAKGPWGWKTLLLTSDGESFYREGRGARAEGVFPFLDRFHISSRQTQRLWQAQAPYFERVTRLLDCDAQRFMTQRQSLQEPPCYWLHSSNSPAEPPNLDLSDLTHNYGAVQLTQNQDPLPWYKEVRKQLIQYKRSDGLALSGVLYLPPDHNPEQDGPLPTILWAYPEEHKSRDTASQVTTSEHTFSRPQRTSILFLLTQGYAVLLGPSMPIVGEADAEPNDTYIEQLVDSAKAAVDYLVAQGVSKLGHVAIGGHSYGAFTTANLLAHCDLFCAGLARSGAYNRTLTPFGFQGEQRNFWKAQETYMEISPFTHADKIDSPLLLIHGAEDNNAGTYPLQSERLYEAMRGLGKTVRWVELPLEGHGYRSQEAIAHVQWEMVRWCDRYVKHQSEN